MKRTKTALLLMNVGSPDEPTTMAVRRFLSQFLNDKRVIDLPWLFRKLLVNLIIIPFRVKKSTALYVRLWSKKGSPLIYHSEKLKEKLQQQFGSNFTVFLGMRYGNPGYRQALKQIKEGGFERIVLLPLFPQHAMSTTETAFYAAEKEISKQGIKAEIIKIEQFYNHPEFIETFAGQIKKYDPDQYDHIVFSYHGIPNRQVEKSHPKIKIATCSCSQKMPEYGKRCYRATCYATTRLLANALKLAPGSYSVAFQSRLTKNWLAPFTDDVLLEKLKEGKTKILVATPSFVTDCLETIIEIGDDYKQLFTIRGGKTFQLVRSLNAENAWVNALAKIIQSRVNEVEKNR
ncbi:MAG: ferrochelatase [Prolixibacteraceae bacterium]|nr:ferrochelatase [Prolixibacteraceae bacterium]